MRKILSRCRFASFRPYPHRGSAHPPRSCRRIGHRYEKGLGGVGSLNAIPTRYQRSIHAALAPRSRLSLLRNCKSHEIDEIIGIAVAQQFRIPTTRASAFSAIDSSWDRGIKSKHQPARCASGLRPHVSWAPCIPTFPVDT